MAYGLFKVTITDSDYHYTKYVVRVNAMSKQQAIVKAAALVGGEKTRREWQRMHRDPVPESLIDPAVTIEVIGTDEFYGHQQDQVEVTEQ